MKVFFVSLGCDKNLVDTEYMLGLLDLAGYEITDDETEAEIIIVNTCCFILDAKEESINALIEYGKLKSEAKLKVLIATGCLAQRYALEIHEEIPEVDALLGTASFDEIVKAVNEAVNGNAIDFFKSLDAKAIYSKKRLLTNGGHFAYLKIAEGCDKKCTYCIIPTIRGSYRSLPIEVLINEAQMLADKGVKEIIIVAQEITVYGIDLYGKKCLTELLRKLCKIDGIEWIRLLYCYPEEIDDELIQTIKEEDKICKYIDMPIQHASDLILQKMGRRTNREFLEKLITKLRTEIPNICLRTTLITGFPGESQEDFECLYNFVDENEFDRLGVFAYSAEEGTIAEQMKDQIEEDIKNTRREEIMLLQQEIAFDKAKSHIGEELTVMIEGRIVEDNILVARSFRDAPDVDGYVFIETDRDLESGCFVKVRITGSREYDLIGDLIDEFTE